MQAGDESQSGESGEGGADKAAMADPDGAAQSGVASEPGAFVSMDS